MTLHGLMANGSKFTTAATQPLMCSVGTFTNKASKVMYFNETTIVDYDANNASSWEIEPNEYMVIARNALSSSIFYVANTNDIITLYNDAGTSLDQATWTFSSSGAPSGVSLEEDAASPTNDWVATNTPHPAASTQAVALVDQPFTHPIWSSTK